MIGNYAPRQGTRAWWQWYATVYLPQYYNQAQVQRYIQQSPYYYQYGNPVTQYQYQYAQYNPYPYQYQYPTPNYAHYGYNQPYYDPYAQYQQYAQGAQVYQDSSYGSAQCAAQGGYWDVYQQTCNAQTGQPVYGAAPPNVIGLPEQQAINMLNAAGFNVWELNVDGQSRGVPQGYSQNRVSISVARGVVTAAAVG